MPAHKHAALIKAWADGAQIQIEYSKGVWRDDAPTWLTGYNYRVKPPAPNYGAIARKAWYDENRQAPAEVAWEVAASAVIDAYKKWEG